MEKEADSDTRQILFNTEKDKSRTYQKSRTQRSTHPDETIKTETCSGYNYAEDRCAFKNSF